MRLTGQCPPRSSGRGYSGAEIALHWSIAALLLVQWFTRASMRLLWQAFSGQGDPIIPFGEQLKEALHMVSGITLFFLAAMLLFQMRGRSLEGGPTSGTPRETLARWTQRGLAFTVLLLPVFGTGAAGHSPTAATLHVILTRVLLALLALHLTGTLWHLLRRDGRFRAILVPAHATEAGEPPAKT
ncbi:cytochrome b561 [Faunimonas pinastri]|uniref:Cytochrome b561 n=1 Tax=Faunimonas pinastri TaxID=1855383 RepID=A0A1H9NGK7_9HYPH|nr:cytochrome b/b6 domain-containing protein [Faunimonas pinastri]SER35090.1 cytochrome b561 [Faunimonas pinastri]